MSAIHKIHLMAADDMLPISPRESVLWDRWKRGLQEKKTTPSRDFYGDLQIADRHGPGNAESFYLISCGDGVTPDTLNIKVGISHNPRDRVLTHQIGNPRKIETLLIVSFTDNFVAKRWESIFFRLLGSLGYHLRGEWFEVPKAFFSGTLVMPDRARQDAVDILRSLLTAEKNDHFLMFQIAGRYEGELLITRHSSLVTAPEAHL